MFVQVTAKGPCDASDLQLVVEGRGGERDEGGEQGEKS